jgi:hypothetical protein
VEGPLFVAVNVTVPDVPGVIVGDDTDTAMSAERAPAVTVVDETLSAVAGSVVVVEAATEPPEIVAGACAEASDTGIATDEVAPTARSPLIVQGTVPLASVQPGGSAPAVTPAGGVYTKVVGPTARDGPLFVAVNVTVPEVPGVIVGDDTHTATSAERAPAVTVVGLTELSAVDGSAVPVAMVADPPVTAPGACVDASATWIDTLADAPFTRPVATTHVTVPEDAVQPAGNEPSVTPAGGV